MSQSRWLLWTLFFALCLVPIPADAQPASFPTEWLLFDSDPNEGFAQNDFRDVTAASFNVEDGFLFLRLQTVEPAGWPSTGSQGAARYKFFFDTANADGAVVGGNINDAEFLLMLEDLTLNTADPTLTRDLLGELTFLDDLANVGFTARWDSTNPPKYTTNAVGSSFWRRELGSGTPGTGGPQGVFGTDIGYRIDGHFVDMYVDLDLLGNPTELRLLWATDQMNPNLDQAPNVDRPEEGFLLVPLVGTIEIAKDAVPDSSQEFSFSGDLGAFTLTDDGVTPAIETFSMVEPGQYDVTETVPAGWTLGSVVCADPDVESTGDVATATASIDLDPGETVSCLFTDTETPPDTAEIVIVKDAVPDGPQTFDFTGDLGAFSLTDDGPIAKTITFSGLAAGVYDVTETVPSGWDLADVVCVDPSGGTTVDLGTATASIDLAAEETVTCTFFDEQRGSITIVKDALPDDPTSFDFTGDLGAFALQDDGVGANGTTFTDLLPGTYEVTEVVPAEWLLVQIECVDPDGGSSFLLATATATIDLDPGEAVTCTFTDALPATLEIIKDTEPEDPQDFVFSGDLGPFTLDDPAMDDADGVPQSMTFTGLGPFPLQITEEVTLGWTLSTVVCNDPDGGSSFEPATRTLTADLDPDETVSCTFTNIDTDIAVTTGTIVIAKDAVPDSAQVFDFTGSDPIGAFTLDDDGVGTLSATFTGLTAGTFTVTETVPAGWLLGSLVCEDPDGQTTVDLASATATIDLDTGETVSCLFTDTEIPPEEGSITIVKDAQPDSAQAFGFTGSDPIGAFSLTDQGIGAQSRTFPGLAPGSYQVTEQLPAEWNLSSIDCVDPDAGTTVNVGTATATIDLDDGESVTCTFVDTSAGGTVTVVKDATPVGAQGFQFITDLGAFILVDDGTGAADSATFNGVASGSYDLTEVVPDGWTLGNLVCDDPDGQTTVDLATATALIDVDGGETITCTFVNRQQVPSVLEIPTASTIGLLLLAIGLGVVGLWALRGGMLA